MNTKTILIFCSWLSIDGVPGIFFREQARIVSDSYHPILVKFEENQYGFRSLLRSIPLLIKKKFYQITNKKSKEGLDVITVRYPKFWFLHDKLNNTLKDSATAKLNRFLVKRNYNISFIHAQSLFMAGFWAYRYWKRFKVPYLLTEHNQLSLQGVSNSSFDQLKRVLENSKFNLVVSNDKIRQFAANRLFYDFINIGNLIHPCFYYRERDRSQKPTRFITIGAFDKFKDHVTLFTALNKLDSKLNKSIEFVWIGYNGWGYDEEENTKKFLSKYEFKNIKLFLYPTLERQIVAEELQKSNLFVFTSISEGMPVSVLEALACGVPVFTSNCGGVDEIINPENGRIFQIKDTDALSDLLYLFVNGTFEFNAKDISSDIIEKFGEKAFKQKLVKIYSKMQNDV